MMGQFVYLLAINQELQINGVKLGPYTLLTSPHNY